MKAMHRTGWWSRYGWVIGLVLLGLIGATWWYVTDIRPERLKAVPGDIDDSLNRPTGRLDGLDIPDTSTTGSICPDPLELATPVDLSRVTSILYPGQVRGGDYKPHGGFRFADGTNEEITVTAPLAARLVQASRYLEQGEVQYLFEFESDCGVSYRFDHLLTLTPKFEAATDSLPAAKPDDSRTTNLRSPVSVESGEPIATAVGIKASGNSFVDFGVYDFRTPNEASQDPAWAAQHANGRELANHALCWLDLLPASDATTVRDLPPGDGQSGAQSDYCTP